MLRTFLQRNYLIYYIFILLFVLLFVTVESLNGKWYTNDFRVYFKAVNDFFAGNDPYVHNYGLDTGYFKYPPTTLYLFGFYIYVPFWVGQIIHLILSVLGLMIAIPIFHQLLKPYVSPKQHWILYFAFLCIATQLVRELHMGNVNLVLLGLFAVGTYSMERKHWITVTCWSLMIILKPIMILCILPLIIFKKYKLVFHIGLMGIGFFLFPIIHLGLNSNIAIWQGWISSISSHGEYIVSSNSLRFISNYYFGTSSEWLPSIIGLILLTALYVRYIWSNKTTQSLYAGLIIFTAFIPNFFVTDTQHFLLTVPLIVVLLQELAAQRNIIYWSIFGVAFALFSLNSNDLLGRELADFMSDRGSVGIGNMLFILLYLYLIDWSKTKKVTTAS